MLYLMAFGALVGFGAAYETAYESTMYQSMTTYEDEPIYAQQYSSTSESGERHHHDGDHHGDYHHGYYYDWLSPGGVYYWGYPSYYYTSWYYPTYTYTYYTYPVYHTWYSTPVVYDWVVDPWWAVNVYGIGSTTYYYSSSSSWSYHGGFFFGP
ncbi:MAG: hypothetical protein QUS09_05405 [Methanotrichaceae archaeon]|nr:hypothetical protein [Methanotrichaceae archaeon]